MAHNGTPFIFAGNLSDGEVKQWLTEDWRQRDCGITQAEADTAPHIAHRVAKLYADHYKHASRLKITLEKLNRTPGTIRLMVDPDTANVGELIIDQIVSQAQSLSLKAEKKTGRDSGHGSVHFSSPNGSGHAAIHGRALHCVEFGDIVDLATAVDKVKSEDIAPSPREPAGAGR